jgi:iron complex outermembrane receptor protein
MRTRRIQTALSLVIVPLALSCAQAQQAPKSPADSKPVELPTVEVTGTPLPAEALTQPAPQSQAQALQSVPGGTNLVDDSQFKTGRAATIVDMLRDQPGIVTGSRGNADEAKVSIRGSGVDRNFHLRGIRLLQDGIPMNQADGNADFQWLEPLAVRNIEVYRGGDALQYGATTLGGAINFVSPTGYTAPGLQARVETGSYGYIKGQVSSGRVLGKLDYYASGTGFYQNGFQEHSRSRAQRYNANIGYRFSDNLETRFYGGFVDSKLQLPGSLTRDELFHHPRVADPSALDFDQQHNVFQGYLANKTTWRFLPHQQLEASVYWVTYRLDHPLTWSPFFLNGLGVLDQRANTYGTNWRYVNTQPLFGQRNRLVFGVNPQFGYTHEMRFQNLSGRKRGMKVADSGQFSTNVDLYAENQHYVLKNLAVVLGGNASYAVRDYHDRFNRNPNGNQTRNRDYWGVNPKVGLLYNLTPASQLYANFTRSFEPPTMLEVVQLGGTAGNVLTTNLKAQTANTIEIGTRGRLKRLAWDTTFYRSWVRNELFTLNDAFGNPQGTMNGSRTYHQGVEAGVSLVLAQGLLSHAAARPEHATALSSVGPGLMPEGSSHTDRLVLRQVYDWNDLHFRDDPVYGHNRLPGVPPQLYRAELIYEHPCGFYIQPNLEWSFSKYPADYANTLTANPYAILGLRTGYQSKRGWSAFVEFRNMTNKHYASAVQVVADARTGSAPRVFSPGQGFSVYGGLEWRR